MPFVLSGSITTQLPGLWGEGTPYERSLIYDIDSKDPGSPPVNYAAHLLKPHSIPHIDAASHILPEGKCVEEYFQEGHNSCFYGEVLVVKLARDGFTEKVGDSMRLWRIGKEELISEVEALTGSTQAPSKLFLTAEAAPLISHDTHDPNYVMVLDEDSAHWLVSNEKFDAYGTSWKSSDFQPGSRERPIHKILLRQAVLFECLKLHHVPAGRYFLSAFPLLLEGASESPVTPVLFAKSELQLR